MEKEAPEDRKEMHKEITILARTKGKLCQDNNLQTIYEVDLEDCTMWVFDVKIDDAIAPVIIYDKKFQASQRYSRDAIKKACLVLSDEYRLAFHGSYKELSDINVFDPEFIFKKGPPGGASMKLEGITQADKDLFDLLTKYVWLELNEVE